MREANTMKTLLLLWLIIIHPSKAFEETRSINLTKEAFLLIILALLLSFVNIGYSTMYITFALLSSLLSILLFVAFLNYFAKKTNINYGYYKLLTCVAFSLSPSILFSIICLILSLHKFGMIYYILRIIIGIWSIILLLIGIQLITNTTKWIAFKLYLRAIVFAFCTFLLLGLILSFFKIPQNICKIKVSAFKESDIQPGKALEAKVIDIEDGDILLNNGDKVKLIGIIIPDEDHARNKTLKYMKEWLLEKNVKLYFDSNYHNINYKDNEGRLLAYVYVETMSPQSPEIFTSYVGKYLKKKKFLGDTYYFYEIFFSAQMIYDKKAKTDRKANFTHKNQFIDLEKGTQIKPSKPVKQKMRLIKPAIDKEMIKDTIAEHLNNDMSKITTIDVKDNLTEVQVNNMSSIEEIKTLASKLGEIEYFKYASVDFCEGNKGIYKAKIKCYYKNNLLTEIPEKN